MRFVFFAILGVNAAVLLLQLTVWAPSPVEDSVTTVKSAAAGETLILLAESGGSDPSKAAEPPRSVQGAPVDRPADGLCDMVGPFERLLSAEYFVEALAALDVGAQVRELDVPEGDGFWVYLPPEASKKEALARLREVQAKQIDSYLIPKGELENGISFGMFTRRELALARQEAMQAEGYPAEIKEIARTRKEIWVELASSSAQKLSEDTWRELLSREKAVKKQQKYCPGVASGKTFQ